MVVLPEMFATGFSMNVDSIAETGDGKTIMYLKGLAKKYGVWVVGSLVAKSKSGKGLNRAIVFDPAGQAVGKYDKMHPFSYAGETDHYDAGDELFTFYWSGIKVAPLVCYDLRFPEVFRAAIAQGVQMFTIGANWPAARAHHWRSLLVARAIENQAYVVGLNRCGKDPNHEYRGDSAIIEPQGTHVAEAGSKPCVIYAEIDIEELKAYRLRFPALDDMRKW